MGTSVSEAGVFRQRTFFLRGIQLRFLLYSGFVETSKGYLLTFPHFLQWCLRMVRVKRILQPGSSQVAIFEPSFQWLLLIPSSSGIFAPFLSGPGELPVGLRAPPSPRLLGGKTVPSTFPKWKCPRIKKSGQRESPAEGIQKTPLFRREWAHERAKRRSERHKGKGQRGASESSKVSTCCTTSRFCCRSPPPSAPQLCVSFLVLIWCSRSSKAADSPLAFPSFSLLPSRP